MRYFRGLLSLTAVTSRSAVDLQLSSPRFKASIRLLGSRMRSSLARTCGWVNAAALAALAFPRTALALSSTAGGRWRLAGAATPPDRLEASHSAAVTPPHRHSREGQRLAGWRFLGGNPLRNRWVPSAWSRRVAAPARSPPQGPVIVDRYAPSSLLGCPCGWNACTVAPAGSCSLSVFFG